MKALVGLSLAAALLLVPAGAAAARGVTTTYDLVGYEYAFSSTVGRFAGRASGAGVDVGAWNARVVHDRLGSSPSYVNGGSFRLATHRSGWSIDEISGKFVEHGGTIRTLDPGRNCSDQRYEVTGRLRDVNGGAGGGDFSAILTHYRVSLLGHCVIYKARVAGNLRLSN